MPDKPLSVERTLQKAKTLAKRGEREQSAQLYRAVLERFPHNRRATQGLMSLAQSKSGPKKPGSVKGPAREQIDGLMELYNQERLEEALERGTRLSRQFPDNSDIPNILGAVNTGLGRLEDAVASFTLALRLKPDAADVYNNLGVTLKALGRYEEAVTSYNRALQLTPDSATAHNNLGNALMALGRHDEAITRYTRTLELDPGNESARHLLNALSGRTSARPPRKFVSDLFDKYADEFDDSLKDGLGYDTPSLIGALLERELDGRGTFDNAVDLGCGTGLCGVEVRNRVKHLTGVDLSAKMIQKAEDRGIYDRLVLGDLVEELEKFPETFDLFICADTFIYVGELSDLFRNARRAALPDALFVSSTEHQATGAFTLLKSARYSHSKAYIEETAAGSGWTVEHFEEYNLRKERGEWIRGGLYMLKAANG